jgi:hypothetical protein
LPDLNLILGRIRDNLAEGAVGLVEVPNFEMILRKKLFSEFTPDHLFYFTKATLRIVLEMNGFEVIDCRKLWHDYIISAIVRKRSTTNADFYRQQLKIKKILTKYCRPFGKVAVWGAGHQALAVISLAGLVNRITYVVDSSKQKQGKYTPVSHLPIVSPQRLKKEPVRAIIIMAAGYSDEVAKIIRRDFDKKIKVAILRDYGLEFIK